MGHDWLYHNLLLLGQLWLSMLLYWAWLRGRSATSPTFPSPAKPIKKRTQQPKPFNFVLPHASLHRPLPQPEPTNGTGSAKQWRPCTPAMRAGLTDHVWTLREVLMFRVPPWPQSQAL